MIFFLSRRDKISVEKQTRQQTRPVGTECGVLRLNFNHYVPTGQTGKESKNLNLCALLFNLYTSGKFCGEDEIIQLLIISL